MNDSGGGSKRQSLRFAVEGYELHYKTEFEDGTASLLNISAGGCALTNLSVPVKLHERVLLILTCDDESLIEIGGIIVRVANQRETAIKFLQLSEENRHNVVKLFARMQRIQRNGGGEEAT